MTRESKLRAHLEHIIFEDLPEGTRLNAKECNALCDAATSDQKRRSFYRGLKHIPLLLDDERIETGDLQAHLDDKGRIEYDTDKATYKETVRPAETGYPQDEDCTGRTGHAGTPTF